jgi:hypothetical protein
MAGMMRASAVPFAASLGALLVACTAGDLPPGGSGDAAVSDGRTDARGLVWIDAPPGQMNNLPCENAVSPAPDLGHHEPGKSCFQSCHNHGFTLAGTLYTNATGNTAFAGATVTVTDAASKTFKLVTNLNGNFYTNTSITFPVLVIASACPSAVKMVANASTGACNTCHVGSTNNQMHLP